MSTSDGIDLDLALQDPAAVFASPEQVVGEPRLTREQKIRVLERWEADARELDVAEDENMIGGEPSMLDRVAAALRALGAEPPHGRPAPNKQSYR